MSDTEPDSPRMDVTGGARDHLAWLRTRLAVERTLMAWVRTASSLIAFGFSMVVFFDQFARMQGVTAPRAPGAARLLGLALVAFGTVALAISLVQFRLLIRYLRGEPFAAMAAARRTPGQAPLLAIAVALIVIGVLAFATIVARGV